MRLLASFSWSSQFFSLTVLLSSPGGTPEDERLDEFPNVVTNSGGALIGGSCTGGLLLLCVVLYFLYKLLKDDPSVHPTAGHVPQPDAVTNQNRASCPHCRNVPSGPPPAYNEAFAMGECAVLSCACMSAPPANSKQPAIWPKKWLSNWFSHWLADWLSVWLVAQCLTVWLADWPTGKLYSSDWLTDDWLTDWWLTDWLMTDWLTDWWLTDWLMTDWLTDWLMTDSINEWMNELMNKGLNDWLMTYWITNSLTN